MKPTSKLAPPFSGGNSKLRYGPDLPPPVALIEEFRPNYTKMSGRQMDGYKNEAWLEWSSVPETTEDLKRVFEHVFSPVPGWVSRTPVLGDEAPEYPTLSLLPKFDNFLEHYEEAFQEYTNQGYISRATLPSIVAEREAARKQVNYIASEIEKTLGKIAQILKVLIAEKLRFQSPHGIPGGWARSIWHELIWGQEVLYQHDFSNFDMERTLEETEGHFWEKEMHFPGVKELFLRQQKIGFIYYLHIRQEKIERALPFEGRRQALEWLLYYGLKGESAPFRDKMPSSHSTVNPRTQHFARHAFVVLQGLKEKHQLPISLNTLWKEIKTEIGDQNPNEDPPSTGTIRNWLWAKVPGGGFEGGNQEKWDFVVDIIERLGQPDS